MGLFKQPLVPAKAGTQVFYRRALTHRKSLGPRFRGDERREGKPRGRGSPSDQIPASLSHSTIFCLGMAPTFIDAIWPSLKSIIVGMPRTP